MYIENIPIVSLDSIYIQPDEENILFLDCTRLGNSKELVSRNKPNELTSVDQQIRIISQKLKQNNMSEILLADDVIFSGNVLRTIIQKFSENRIKVLGIRGCISMTDSYEYFNQALPLGLKCGICLGKEVIDQICERDFYFGIVQSGISVKDKNGKISKSPYFIPFGNPVERASIPEKYDRAFSLGCLERSKKLWERIEELSQRDIFVNELPERILGVNSNERIVDLLERKIEDYEKVTNRNNGVSR